MHDHRTIVDAIERATDDHPFCSTCGAHTDVTEREGTIWLECSSLARSHGNRLRALIASLVPHDRRRLLDLAG